MGSKGRPWLLVSNPRSLRRPWPLSRQHVYASGLDLVNGNDSALTCVNPHAARPKDSWTAGQLTWAIALTSMILRPFLLARFGKRIFTRAIHALKPCGCHQRFSYSRNWLDFSLSAVGPFFPSKFKVGRW